MNIKPFCLVLLCFSAPALHAGDSPLFRTTSKAEPGAGDRQPDMVFQEVERNDTASTVEASFTAGSVAAKSMFLLRGSCALMKYRQKPGFRIERLSRQPVRMRVQFVSDEEIGKDSPAQPIDEGSVISAARCAWIESSLAR